MKKGILGVAAGKEILGTSGDEKNVSNTKNHTDTVADELKATGLGVGKVPGDQRQRVHEQIEGPRDGAGSQQYRDPRHQRSAGFLGAAQPRPSPPLGAGG